MSTFVERQQAIINLSNLLKEFGIKHVLYVEYSERVNGEPTRGNHERNQVKIPTVADGSMFLSAICHFGGYGHERALIEVYNFFDEPIGYLTPQQAFDQLIKWLKEYGLYDTN